MNDETARQGRSDVNHLTPTVVAGSALAGLGSAWPERPVAGMRRTDEGGGLSPEEAWPRLIHFGSHEVAELVIPRRRAT
jgi:hypothetical protein